MGKRSESVLAEEGVKVEESGGMNGGGEDLRKINSWEFVKSMK